MTDNTVHISRTDAVVTITLDRPPVNALDETALGQLTEAVHAVRDDPSARALVLAGGATSFCAGAEISMLAEATETASGRSRIVDFVHHLSMLLDDVSALAVPTVASLAGSAVGGGLELALATDLRVAGADVRIGLPEIRLGLVPGAGGTQRLTELVGRSQAIDLVLRGEIISGNDAHRLGIVQHLTNADVDGYSARLATQLAAQHAGAATWAKRCIAAAPSPEGFRLELEATESLYADAQTQRLLQAFLEGRQGNGKGADA